MAKKRRRARRSRTLGESKTHELYCRARHSTPGEINKCVEKLESSTRSMRTKKLVAGKWA